MAHSWWYMRMTGMSETHGCVWKHYGYCFPLCLPWPLLAGELGRKPFLSLVSFWHLVWDNLNHQIIGNEILLKIGLILASGHGNQPKRYCRAACLICLLLFPLAHDLHLDLCLGEAPSKRMLCSQCSHFHSSWFISSM